MTNKNIFNKEMNKFKEREFVLESSGEERKTSISNEQREREGKEERAENRPLAKKGPTCEIRIQVSCQQTRAVPKHRH